MPHTNPRERARILRQKRVRRKISGTNTCPRLCVYRSGRHIYAQIISDESGATLTAASTLSEEVHSSLKNYATIEAAKAVGTLVAQKCQAKGIVTVVFDRNGFLYHGRVRALAEAAREAGLKF